MKLIKNIYFSLFITICLLTSLYINVSAEKYSFKCCTDPEFIQEANNTLIQKKLTKIDQEQHLWNNEISLFSSSIESIHLTGHLMPSTGTVNALVIPVTFPGHPVSEERLELLKDALFGLHDDRNCFNYEAAARPSAKEFFRDNSNGKLDFTGDLLPLYTTSELPTYYVENDNRLQNLLKEILNYYKSEKIVDNWSKYDSDGDGFIDCLMLLFASFDDLKYGSVNGNASFWNDHVQTISYITIDDSIKLSQNAVISFSAEMTPYSKSATFVHECGHLMGLPDNYSVEGTDNCIIYGTHDFMTSDGGRYYFNPFSRYLLDWIEPKVLPYDGDIRSINLCAYENYDDTGTERAIIFIPDT